MPGALWDYRDGDGGLPSGGQGVATHVRYQGATAKIGGPAATTAAGTRAWKCEASAMGPGQGLDLERIGLDQATGPNPAPLGTNYREFSLVERTLTKVAHP